MNVQSTTRYLIIALAVFAAPPILADEDPIEAEEEPLEIEKSVVTGSRLKGGDPTARILTITSEDIAKRGLSSIEEIIRTIPQIFSSNNSTNSMNFTSFAADDQRGTMAVGFSSANLRGFGSANTLVLMNGHRIAGAAFPGSSNTDFVNNLRNLPAGIIDRVEVNLDGGSSVYGSDGIAGVINIITRKEFTGGRATIRREQSSTGADQSQLSGYFGKHWDGGYLSLNISRTESDPYSTRKAGYYTRDWSFLFDGNPAYNFNLQPRSEEPLDTRSARISTQSPYGPFDLILPEGKDGRNAQPEDFQLVTRADAIDVIELDEGGATEDTSVTFHLEHTFAEKVRVWSDYYRTEADTNARLTRLLTTAFTIPESNAFNNFGQTVYALYDPQTEIELGIIPPAERFGTTVSQRLLGGIVVDFTEDLKLTVDLMNAISESNNYQYMLTDRVTGPLADEQLEERYAERYAELLASSDPDEAINVFGDGTGQNATLKELYGPRSTTNSDSEITKIEGYLNGKIFNLPGGEISFVLGGEIRKEESENRNPFEKVGLGLARPYRDLNAYYAEVAVPILGDGFQLPGISSLVFTASARRDEYTVEGSYENDAQGNPILTEANFGNTSLGFGIKIDLYETFVIRVSADEGFRAPNVWDLFAGVAQKFTRGAIDPLTFAYVPTAFVIIGPNPDLNPERSDNLSVGFEWRPLIAPGLTVTLDYSKIDFQDRITSSSQLGRLLPTEIFANLPEFFERDPDTNQLIGVHHRNVNISRRQSKTLDLEVEWEIRTQRFGWFIPSLYYHYVDSMFDQAAPDAPKASFVGTFVGIDKRKIQARFEWIKDRMAISAFYQYTPGYLNNHYSRHALGFTGIPGRIPEAQVSSWSTVDLSGSYRWDSSWRLRLGGRNIFDAGFPLALNGLGRPYDSSRVNIRGRVWFAEISYEF